MIFSFLQRNLNPLVFLFVFFSGPTGILFVEDFRWLQVYCVHMSYGSFFVGLEVKGKGNV